ncbi:MAG: hypothetical protein SFV51_28215 [Bryobacteraceae bacterium]|nr:hypothetical protein [Bryobacteraceae bacterium]
MKTALLLIAAAGCSLAQESSPCQPKEKPVPCYVRILQAKLAEYRKSVDGQIQSERDLSSALADVLAAEAERNVYELLQIERYDNSFRLASDLAEERLTPSQLRERLRDISTKEFEATRQFHEAEMSLLVSVLPALKKNELDTKKLDALQKALTQLSTKPELKTQLADMVAFAKDFQNIYELEGCKDLARAVSITGGSIATLKLQTGEPGLESRVKALEQRRSDTEKVLSRHPRYKSGKCQ